MPHDASTGETAPHANDDEFDFFVSYARADNARVDDAPGWVEQFIAALLEEHKKFAGGRTLRPFFDRNDIRNFAHWETEIFHKGLTRSRLFLAFLSPRYFASEVCRREWKAWISQEIGRHILTAGAAPIYFVEVPGFVSKPMLTEQEVARNVADLCNLAEPRDPYFAEVAPVLKEFRRRQAATWFQDNAVVPFFNAGKVALEQSDLRAVLRRLAEDLETRTADVRRAEASESTVPPYNRNFTGRLEELLELRRMLKDDRTGVVCGVAGLGGIGKTELAFTFAHAFGGVYPGGRFYVPCERAASLRDAALVLGDLFRDQIAEEERMQPDRYFEAIVGCLRRRLQLLGPILLVLDNVADAALLQPNQTDQLTVLGPTLHILATTRLLPTTPSGWLTLGELSPSDALALLEKGRPFADEPEREAARQIVQRLGGFTLAVELVAAWLASHPETSYHKLADGLGLEDLETIAGSEDIKLRHHNHERRLTAVLSPVLRSLSAAEHRTLQYASLMPPDQVPLPWLRELVTHDYPKLAKSSRLSDPWLDVCRKLQRLALLTPADGEGHAPRMVRVHRLVQELIRNKLWACQLKRRQSAFDDLIVRRNAALQKATRWQDVRWEVEPLDALALLWADGDHPDGIWLLNQVGPYWKTLCEWNRAEVLMRRAILVAEKSDGREHPNVAITLSSLATLFFTTNRLREAEPLMRRGIEIMERAGEPGDPHLAGCFNNLAQVLDATNRFEEAEPLMRRLLADAERSLGSDDPEVGIRLGNLAKLLQATNRFAEAEPLSRRALAIAEKCDGLEHPKVAVRLLNLSTLLLTTNRLAEAEQLIRRALSIDERAYGTEHPSVATDLNNLGQFLFASNRLAEAEPVMRRSLMIAERSHGPDHPMVATDLGNLAILLLSTNRFAEAEPLIRRALAIDERSFGPEHPDTARDLRILARLFSMTNRLAEAERLLYRTLDIYERSFGSDHFQVAADLRALARILQSANRLSEAEPLIRRALSIDERSFGPEHPRVAGDLYILAPLLLAMNRPTEAEPLMRRTLDIYERSVGPEHPFVVAAALGQLANLLQATNRPMEAEPLLRRVLDIYEQSYGPDHPEVATARNNLARLLQATNRLTEAEPLLHRALDIYEQSYGPNHPTVATALNNLARLLQDTNRLTEAEPLLRRALAIAEQSYGPGHPTVETIRNNLEVLLRMKN